MAWRVTKHRPRYLKSELIRTYAGEQPDYFDVEKNKWFSCDAGSELVTNGTFDVDTSGWNASAGAILSIANGRLRVAQTTGDNVYAYQAISVQQGVKYKIKGFMYDIANNDARIALGTTIGAVDIKNISDESSSGVLVDYEVIAPITGTVYLSLRNNTTTDNTYSEFDNISVFPVEITPTTEIPESRNYMNHIVHADSQGNPLYVEELPKVKYENLIVQGENRKVINLGTIYYNNRYVVENPFGNEKYMDCDVRAEILYNGKWGETGWDGNAGTAAAAYGTRAHSVIDGIVIQTGTSAVIVNDASLAGHPFGDISSQLSAPARLIVTYVGVAK